MYNHSEYKLKDQAFKYSPMYTLDSTDDFSGAASFLYKDGKASLDLFITSIDYVLSENCQIFSHLGDTYSSIYFGKRPMELTIEAILPDSTENFGKTNLVNAYKNYFRVSAVSRLKEAPTLLCKNFRFTGPLSKMVITEDSTSIDTCTVILTMLVQKFSAIGESTFLTIDYEKHLDSVIVPGQEAAAIQAAQNDVRITSVKEASAGKLALHKTPTDIE